MYNTVENNNNCNNTALSNDIDLTNEQEVQLTTKPKQGMIRSVETYEKITPMTEGTFVELYMAQNKETGEIVTLRQIRAEKEGFPNVALREIKFLSELKHENIIQLKEVVSGKQNGANTSIYVVFEYMEHNLYDLLSHHLFTASQIKCYMKQLLQGIHYCHSKGVLHRDLSCSNILINNQGQLKIADFRLARTHLGNDSRYTPRVVTLWYRPPELLLGTDQYGPEVDMWSVGCILAEMVLGKPLFPGKHELDQMEYICRICGSPSEENWPGFTKLPMTHLMKLGNHSRALKHFFKDAHTLDLVDKLLAFDPSKRLSASDALDHDYFWTEPLPCEPSDFPKYPEAHLHSWRLPRRDPRSTSPLMEIASA